MHRGHVRTARDGHRIARGGVWISGASQTVRDMVDHWQSGTVHFDSFAASNANARENTPFTVRLSRSGTSFDIPANRSILDMLRDYEKESQIMVCASRAKSAELVLEL